MERSGSKSGMTFIEVFAVIVILGVLMGGLTVLARHSRFAANQARARADIADLSEVVEHYARTFGAPPAQAELEACSTRDSRFEDGSWAITNLWRLWEDEGGRPYPFATMSSGNSDAGGDVWNWSNKLSIASNIDPWGRPYRYRPLGRNPEEIDEDDVALEGEDTFEIYSCGPWLEKMDAGDRSSKAYTNDDIFLAL
jgi:type II secretory pathway pseudopilin PulG